MVPSVSAKVGENAKTECCTKCRSSCFIGCWPFGKTIERTDSQKSREIEKVIEVYEKRRNSIVNDFEIRKGLK